MSENLCLDVAQRRVRDYTDEADSVIAHHFQAEDCWKCQEFIQKGISAYKWLRRAEEFMREADYQGIQEYTTAAQDAVEAMYRAWLCPCEFAEQWIKSNIERGFHLDNLVEFREICEEVQDVIQNREWRHSAKRARIMASYADPEE